MTQLILILPDLSPLLRCLLRCQHVAGQHCYSDLAEFRVSVAT